MFSSEFIKRLERFAKAWSEIAPNASFAEMDLTAFKAATGSSFEERNQLSLLNILQDAAISRRNAADRKSKDLMKLVVNAVRGHPTFGDDSPLYRALGFVPNSERKSGLTRRGKEESTTKDG